MTNREFLAVCSKEELALTLLSFLVDAVEGATHAEVPEKVKHVEYAALLNWLDEKFLEPSKYVS